MSLSLKKQGHDPSEIPNALFIITNACDHDGRAGFAFALAANAAAYGRQVHVFLILEGCKWAFKKYSPICEHSQFDKQLENLNSIIELGGQVIVCQTSHSFFRKEYGDLREGLKIGSFCDIETITKQQTIVYNF